MGRAMDLPAHCLLRIAGDGFALACSGARDYEVQLRHDAWRVLTGTQSADLNYAYVADGARAADNLREHTAVLRARDLPGIVFGTPGNVERLAPLADQLGLTYVGAAPFMVCAPDEHVSASHGYEVDRIDNEAHLQELLPLIAAAFSLDPEHVRLAMGATLLESPCVDVFVASRDGEPLSTVTATRHGAIVGIWTMATPPQHQRQGAGRAVLDFALTWHTARGAQLFFLFASAAGKPLYDRVGFRTLVEAPTWVYGSSTQMPGH